MTSQADFNRARVQFMHRAAAAPDVSPAAFKLAWLICFKYMNRESRTAHPAQETLAADLNASVRTIQRLLNELRPLGLTIRAAHGPNQASSYGIEPEKATPVSPIQGRKGDIRRHEKATSGDRKGDTHVAPTNKKNQRREPRREESDSRPLDDVGLKQGDSRASKKSKFQICNLDEAFAEFWAAYPRRVAKEAARKAFSAAVAGGTGASTIVDGARRYAIERNGEPPRYTKHPATWLRGGCWTDEPVGAPVIDEAGQLVAYEQPQQQQSSGRGFATIAEELNAELAALGKEWF